MAILGIDLGTTNSLGAIFRNNKVEFIPNSLGQIYTPSVVAVTPEGDIVTGAIAREMMITSPKNSVAEFKQFMGLPKNIELGKYSFSPEELSSFIISSIVEDAKKYLGEDINDVIISVPAYFHDSQRKATRKAGALAGVKVLRIINEPSAAALSSYLDRRVEELFLVFDFGGGTLDISIVDCFDTMVEIVGISGDTIGGKDIDLLVAKDFLREHNLSMDDLSVDYQKKAIRSAERCKINLTDKKSVEMSLVIRNKEYVSTFDNERMITICKPIFAKMKVVMERCFKSSGLRANNISKVILAGGSSNMPVVQLYIKLLFKNTPIICKNSNDMIAKGLGVYTGIMQRYKEVSDYVMTDICPFSLGTQIVNKNDADNDYMSVIIPKNSVLPISRTERYQTVNDNQKNIRYKVLQGEHVYANQNREIGVLDVPVPKNKAGEEKVDITYTYDLDGILIVKAYVVSTGKTYQLILASELTDEEIQKKTKQLHEMKLDNRDSDVVKYIKTKLDSIYQEIDSDRQPIIMSYMRDYEDILSSGDKITKLKFEKFITQLINDYEHYDPFELTDPFEE